MLADQSAHVAAVAAGFRAEARRVGRVTQRQILLVQNLVAVQIRERNLGGRHEVIVALESKLEEVGFELRKLPSAEERVFVDYERRQNLAVAMFRSVQVEHEIDQRAFEFRAQPAQNGESGAGYLRRALLIENTQTDAEIDVVLRLEAFGGEIARRPPSADFHVGRFVGADGNRFMGQVRDAGQYGAELALHLGEFSLEAFQLFGDGARFGLFRLGLIFFAFAHQSAYFLADAVTGGVQVVSLADHPAAHAVQFGKIVEQRRVEIAGGEFFAHEVEILSHKMNIEHNQSFDGVARFV